MVSFDAISVSSSVKEFPYLVFCKRRLDLLIPLFTSEMLDFFHSVLTSSYFEKLDVVMMMGCPLSSVVADLFMESFDNVLLCQATLKPSGFLQFVDDTLVVWPHGRENLNEFLIFLNDLHPNIKFRMEAENNELPLLAAFVCQKANGPLGGGSTEN